MNFVIDPSACNKDVFCCIIHRSFSHQQILIPARATVTTSRNMHCFLFGPRAMKPSRRDRSIYQINLVFVPLLITYLAFAKSFIHRFFGTPTTHPRNEGPETCKNHEWYNSATGIMTCDKRSLDAHSILALLWLFLFSSQAVCIRFGRTKVHQFLGKYIVFPIAFMNIIGMGAIFIDQVANPNSFHLPKNISFNLLMISSKCECRIHSCIHVFGLLAYLIPFIYKNNVHLQSLVYLDSVCS